MQIHMRTIQRSTWIVVIATTLFVLFFGVTNWVRQVNLVTSQFDMGNMDQTLWHSLHGKWFQMTDPMHPIHELRSSIHADYLLLAYLPFYALFPDPRTPLILQVLAVASGVIPLYLLARKRLGNGAGALLVVAYLLYPAMQWGITFDVHAVILATPLILWAWWAATERHWWLYYSAIFALVLTKEEAGLAVAAMGVYWIWKRGYRVLGAVSIALGLTWFALMIGWAIPSARNAPGHFALGYYADFGGTSEGVVRGIFTHPLKVLHDVYGRDGLVLQRQLLLPVGGIAIVGLPILLVAAPELAINLLSNNANQHTIFFQYMSVIIPFVFLATIDGWLRLRRWLSRRYKQRSIDFWIIAWIILTMGVSTMRWSPLPWPEHMTESLLVFRRSPYTADVKVVQADLRATDRVVATSNLVPQFSRRDYIWAFPNDLEQADAVIVLEGGEHEALPADQISAKVRELSENPSFTLVRHNNLFWYFRRK